MQIIEYEDKYLDNVRDLLVELEEYIISIDKDNLDQLHPDYRKKMALVDLEEVKDKNGECYIAIDNDVVLGLIMGYIRDYDQYDYLDFKCPKSGVISELITTKDSRGKGVGKQLMNTMEEYFKLQGCEYSYVDVFAYNINGINFYDNLGYHTRMETKIKRIGDNNENN